MRSLWARALRTSGSYSRKANASYVTLSAFSFGFSIAVIQLKVMAIWAGDESKSKLNFCGWVHSEF